MRPQRQCISSSVGGSNVFSFLSGGGKKKKSPFKLTARQEVEVEFEAGDGVYESHFVTVQDVQKKKIVIAAPGSDRKPVRLVPGQRVTVSVLTDDTHLSYEASVNDVQDREIELSYPPKDHEEVTLPARDDSFQVKVPIPVEFRAMSTAHTQVANTHAVTLNGLFLTTNLPIPPNTSLLMELEIPNAPDITAKGRAVTSQEDTSTGRKRFITEVEYEDVSEKDRNTIIRYALFYQQRQTRNEKRLTESSK